MDICINGTLDTEKGNLTRLLRTKNNQTDFFAGKRRIDREGCHNFFLLQIGIYRRARSRRQNCHPATIFRPRASVRAPPYTTTRKISEIRFVRDKDHVRSRARAHTETIGLFADLVNDVHSDTGTPLRVRWSTLP